MNKARLIRYEFNHDGVFGVFILNDVIVGYSLENFDKCIPTGKYRCVKDNHGIHRWYRLENVPSRTNIEIHVANWSNQLEGCIAIGSYIGTLRGKRAIMGSRDAMENLQSMVGDNSFDLEIRNG
jgi:hypothetical protein